MINEYTRMGGTQVNITGGEPLTHPDIVHILNSIGIRESMAHPSL
jgi:molybdenum cofactor biosynthesis enzyme MoaA